MVLAGQQRRVRSSESLGPSLLSLIQTIPDRYRAAAAMDDHCPRRRHAGPGSRARPGRTRDRAGLARVSATGPRQPRLERHFAGECRGMNAPEPIPFKTESPQPLLRETPQGAAYPVQALGPL